MYAEATSVSGRKDQLEKDKADLQSADAAPQTQFYSVHSATAPNGGAQKKPNLPAKPLYQFPLYLSTAPSGSQDEVMKKHCATTSSEARLSGSHICGEERS